MSVQPCISVVDETQGTKVASKVQIADSFLPRLVGLLGRKILPAGEGLLIRPCSSIHTFFMKFSIDAIFLGRDMQVVRIYQDLPPWRATVPVHGADSVLEVSAGSAQAASVKVGDKLAIR